MSLIVWRAGYGFSWSLSGSRWSISPSRSARANLSRVIACSSVRSVSVSMSCSCVLRRGTTPSSILWQGLNLSSVAGVSDVNETALTAFRFCKASSDCCGGDCWVIGVGAVWFFYLAVFVVVFEFFLQLVPCHIGILHWLFGGEPPPPALCGVIHFCSSKGM